ncbi:hypothetical protein CAPTEDRAFT_181595 [Capitella teleta]|uniref:Uncharacterized protein n=1 Tax=Capitella teleta TaxID=283909 RepID=R7UHY9_CAPTE|nr:hypothetical protein CAPTEDRAFT_181595 [Capitella teleta]|eukprot:ELU06159.1 hypothetical protein CAPTEDRAFT_181595 [Capitella teleta]
MSLNVFSSKKRGKQAGDNQLPRSIRRFYKMQDEIIVAFEDMQLEVDDAMENTEIVAHNRHLAAILSRVSFVVNLILLVIKSIAGAMTGSLAIISAVVDSAVDLVSGALMWWSNRAMKTRDIYQYPQGRTKLEPIAIVVLSVIMASASIQMIREAVEQLVSFAMFDVKGPPPFNESGVLCATLDQMKVIVNEGTGKGPEFTVTAICICVITVVAKLILFLLCRRIDNASVQALAQDHRNDVLSNTVALSCGLLGAMVWKYADPLGAVFISIYIIVSWFMTGWEQIKMLTGHTARPDFLKKITWIALNHHPKVQLIDTVRAFHFGNNFLVEVDIVLPENMSLKESHDIGESLQLKIERLPEVERSFVHLDYECDHHPWSEHKQV